MENNNVKKAPSQVREHLTRDVHAILSVCIKHFDDVTGSAKEDCFDVDAVIAGRSMNVGSIHERIVTPAAYTRPVMKETAYAAKLTIPQKGYFIPSTYAHRGFSMA